MDISIVETGRPRHNWNLNVTNNFILTADVISLILE